MEKELLFKLFFVFNLISDKLNLNQVRAALFKKKKTATESQKIKNYQFIWFDNMSIT